jgi:hypothetical protein
MRFLTPRAVLGPGEAAPGGIGGSPPGSDLAGLQPSGPVLGQHLLAKVSRVSRWLCAQPSTTKPTSSQVTNRIVTASTRYDAADF